MHARSEAPNPMAFAQMTYNKTLQTDKVNQSRLLYSQKPRQLAFAAELGR